LFAKAGKLGRIENGSSEAALVSGRAQGDAQALGLSPDRLIDRFGEATIAEFARTDEPVIGTSSHMAKPFEIIQLSQNCIDVRKVFFQLDVVCIRLDQPRILSGKENHRSV